MKTRVILGLVIVLLVALLAILVSIGDGDWKSALINGEEEMATLTKTTPGGYIYDDFADGDYTANPTWTVDEGTWDASAFYLTATGEDAEGHSSIHVSLIDTAPNAFIVKGKIYFEHTDYACLSVLDGAGHGYGFFINPDGVSHRIVKVTGNWAFTDLATVAASVAQDTWIEFFFSRNSDGVMNLWIYQDDDNVWFLTATDTDYSDFTQFKIFDRRAASTPKRYDDLEVLHYPYAEAIEITGLLEGYKAELYDGGDVLKGKALTNVHPITTLAREGVGYELPPGYYYNGKTYCAWLDEYYATWINYYNHATDTWSEPVKLGDGDDDHAGPGICVDGSGYIHVVYGCHVSALHYRRSTNPEDISAWEAEKDIATVATYPFLEVVTVGGTEYVYCFYRTGAIELTEKEAYTRTSDQGVNWDAESIFIDFTGEQDAVYHRAVAIGNESPTNSIHIIYTGRDHPGFTGYFDLMYAKSLDGGTTWKEADGTGYALPISFAASEKIITATSTTQIGYDIALDDSNVQYILISPENGTRYYTIYKWTGAAWTTYNITTVTKAQPFGQLIIDSSTELEAYLTTVTPDIELWKSTNGGVNWNKDRTIAKFASDRNPFHRIGGNKHGVVWGNKQNQIFIYIKDEWNTETWILQDIATLAFPFTGYFIIYDHDGNSVGRFPAGTWTDIWAGDIYDLEFGAGAGSSMAAKLIGAGLL